MTDVTSPITAAVAGALRDVQLLRRTHVGALHGADVDNHLSTLAALDRLPQPWADRLAAVLPAGVGGRITPESAEYLVYSDATVLAWVTVHAALVLPAGHPTTTQACTHTCHPVIAAAADAQPAAGADDEH